MSESDNRMRWQRQPGHYEVWYLTLNHRASETGFWIRYTMEAPTSAPPYAQLWFSMFDAREPQRAFAINRKRPIGELEAQAEPFSLRIGQAELRHGSAKGSIEGAGHQASWELEWLPPADSHFHLPAFFYGKGFADTKVLSPSLNTALRGSITCDGRTFTLENEPGCQTHLWGRKHAFAWAWSHCNGFDGHPGVALETLTARLHKKGVTLPPLSLLSLYLEDEVIHFRELQEAPLVRGNWETGSYRLLAQGLNVRVQVEYSCRPDDLVLAPYADPDGEAVFCANTEIADCRVVVSRRHGLSFRPDRELLARRTGHFEYAGRNPDPAVVRRHVTVE